MTIDILHGVLFLLTGAGWALYLSVRAQLVQARTANIAIAKVAKEVAAKAESNNKRIASIVLDRAAYRKAVVKARETGVSIKEAMADGNHDD